MQMSHKCEVIIEPAFCFFAAASLLIIPINWLAAWFLAAAVHELCHCLVLLLCHARIYDITIRISGARIETDALTTGIEIISAIAGPLGGFALCLLSEFFPRIAVCALIQSAYNLLPLFPFDGGRILSCLLVHILGDRRGMQWMGVLETAFLIILVVLAFWVSFVLQFGVLPLLCVMLLTLRSGKLKFPCKAGKQIVQ